MKIARVFPRRTAHTPTGNDCYIGLPTLFTPQDYDQVHISVCFTWDIYDAGLLIDQWKGYGKKVIIGGPAFDDPGLDFIPGLYVKNGITITSRGCNNKCPFCFAWKREGRIRELENVHPGNIVQDNNLLQCSGNHIRKVFNMLRSQKRIQFVGGLDYKRLNDNIIEDLRELDIYELWIACDFPGSLGPVKKVIQKLRKYFRARQIRCYVIIGKDMQEEEDRLSDLYKAGCYPFAQLYQGTGTAGIFFKNPYTPAWRKFQKRWSRPALYKKWIKEEIVE